MTLNKNKSITKRINRIIIASLLIGIGGSAVIFLSYMINTYDIVSIESLGQQADILYNTIETLMLPGEAQLAVDYFQKTMLVNPDYQIRLYKSNGTMAFSNDSTVTDVNRRLGQSIFNLNTNRIMDSIFPEERYFKIAQTPNPNNIPVAFEYKAADSGNIYIKLYRPLQNIYKCWKCHGTDHSIRGVIEISNNRTAIIKERNVIIAISMASFIVLITLLIIIITQFLNRIIIAPVKEIGLICSGVTQGNFTERANIKNNDEIGILGQTVNKMVEGLHERFELSKYVSSSTLSSLRSERKGEKLPLTLFFSDIRNFTFYSEQNAPEKVVLNLNKILNYQSEIIHNQSGDIDKYVGDEIVALFHSESGCLKACQAALSIQQYLMNNPDDFDSLKIGIGINYGEVILGNIGSDKRADFTVIGDNVNTAARLCNVAKAGQIIISDSFYNKVKSHVLVNGPYKVKVKGKAQQIRVYLLKKIKENQS
ncbi:MAG: adenylate/guanylate cyclase domain-containing protein [Spirochaetales bacterium]|nr:adenylate/guanylate cyclase domain-containing protein [Spirochaetales bacterium]